MNDIKFVASGMGRGQLYINGQWIPGVLSVEPNLFVTDDVATVTVTLHVGKFAFVPTPDAETMAALGLKPDDYAP